MNTNAIRPLGLISAIVHFLQDIHRPRNISATLNAGTDELNLLHLYRLSRGRESIAPGVNTMLAKRFKH